MVDFIFIINGIRLDINENKIFNEHKTLFIEPRLVNLLRYFAEHPDTVFSREELIHFVWGNAVVTSQVVTQSVFELRKILSGLGEPDLITTIPKRGYKFSGKVTTSLLQLNEPSNEDSNNENIALMTFPAAPLTRAITNISSKDNELHPIAALRRVGAFLYNRLFDILMFVSLIFIISYSVSYQSHQSQLNKLDSELIAIETKVSPNFDNHLGVMPYGIAQQINYALSAYSHYRAIQGQNLQAAEGIKTAGKTLQISPLLSANGYQLHLILKNNINQHILLDAAYPLTQDGLVGLTTKVTNQVLQELALPHLSAQQILSSIPLNNESVKYLFLAKYYMSLPKASDLSKTVFLLNDLLKTYPDNSYLLAKRFVAYTEQLILDGESPKQDKLFQKYAAALLPFEQNQNLSSMVYDALALRALYDGNLPQAERNISMAKKHYHSISPLTYILLGKLYQDTNPELASDAYNQAEYLKNSPKNHLLIEKLNNS